MGICNCRKLFRLILREKALQITFAGPDLVQKSFTPTGADAVNETLNCLLLAGPSQDWGCSGRDRRLRELIVSRVESLSEAGAECSIVDGGANSEQEIGGRDGISASTATCPSGGSPENWPSPR
jgi:hypothetical protein